MNVRRLEKELDESLQIFNGEMNYLTDTFEQSHKDEYLTKDDLEDIGLQVFYAMWDFKEILIKYLREENR